MFGLVQWEWDYEAIDLKNYIPDFVVHFKAPLLVEVKSYSTLDDLLKATTKIQESGWKSQALVVGGFCARDNNLTMGILGEDLLNGEWYWQAAAWRLCRICGQLTPWSKGWVCLTNGCLGRKTNKLILPPKTTLDHYWASAANDTAWRWRKPRVR
jgi:hypothetical protein